jgi:peptidoglycan/xylan/chitin deacetylase (PgdA/CDA1 family)
MNVISLLFHDVYATDPCESGFRSPGADRYKLSIPDFEAQLDGLTRIPNQQSRVQPVITFDDGGESYYTAAADRLEARGWRGHCFVTTECVGQRGFLTPAQIRELDERGHLIGSHSASHPARFSTLPVVDMLREWRDSRRALEDLLGHAVTTASVPGGYFSNIVANAAAECGLLVLFTSEPTSKTSVADGCTVMGRFTIRHGHAPDMAQRFTASPWTRCGAWAGWNAKAIVKPLLGPSYARVADWLLTSKASGHHG